MHSNPCLRVCFWGTQAKTWSNHLFIQQIFIKASYKPDSGLEPEDIAVNKTEYIPALKELKVWEEAMGNLKNAITLHSGKYCEENDVIAMGAVGMGWSERASLKWWYLSWGMNDEKGPAIKQLGRTLQKKNSKYKGSEVNMCLGYWRGKIKLHSCSLVS